MRGKRKPKNEGREQSTSVADSGGSMGETQKRKAYEGGEDVHDARVGI